MELSGRWISSSHSPRLYNGSVGSNSFYIVPFRKIVGLSTGVSSVLSLNGLQGDLVLSTDSTLELTNPSGTTLELQVSPNLFAQRAGDTILGNLQFSPTASGPYGLKLLASSADPSQNALGALYFNTTSQTLRIYSSGGWTDLASTGALTTVSANTQYLRLDGTNGPMTGNLLMGSALFQLGALTSDPGTASPGTLYYNSSTHVMRIYTGSAWGNVGSGITSVTIGTGLLLNGSSGGTLTSSGTVALDTTISPTWTGSHTFSNAITFASSQQFKVEALQSSAQSTGAIVTFNGTQWVPLAAGTNGQVLTIASGVPSWGSASAGSIGTPTSGLWTSGFFSSWTSSTLVADALYGVSTLFASTAPAQGSSLASAALVQSGLTLYTATLSSGLPSAWYIGGNVAGSTITSYTTSASVSLTTPNSATAFQLGLQSAPSSFGTLNAERTKGTTLDNPVSYTLTTNTSGSNTANSTRSPSFSPITIPSGGSPMLFSSNGWPETSHDGCLLIRQLNHPRPICDKAGGPQKPKTLLRARVHHRCPAIAARQPSRPLVRKLCMAAPLTRAPRETVSISEYSKTLAPSMGATWILALFTAANAT